MFKALVTRDGKEEHLSVYDTKKETPYTAICPGCKAPVRANRGAQKQHYWSHIPGADCSYGAGMTQWHYEWQKRFDHLQHEGIWIEPYDMKELWPNNRPDMVVLHNNTHFVFEFQHSRITQEVIAERERVYENVFWILDGTHYELSIDQHRVKGMGVQFVWNKATQPIFVHHNDTLYYVPLKLTAFSEWRTLEPHYVFTQYIGDKHEYVRTIQINNVSTIDPLSLKDKMIGVVQDHTLLLSSVDKRNEAEKRSSATSTPTRKTQLTALVERQETPPPTTEELLAVARRAEEYNKSFQKLMQLALSPQNRTSQISTTPVKVPHIGMHKPTFRF